MDMNDEHFLFALAIELASAQRASQYWHRNVLISSVNAHAPAKQSRTSTRAKIEPTIYAGIKRNS
jgi:hypothetical protein